MLNKTTKTNPAFFKRLAIAGFTAGCLGVFSLPATAEVQITSQKDAKKIEIKTESSSIGEIAVELTEHLDMELSGEIDSDALVTLDMSGDLKELLTKILGKNNYLLEYSGDQPTRLVVLGVDPNPPGLVTTTATASPIPVEPTQDAAAKASREKAENEGTAVPTAEINRQMIEISKIQSQQFVTDKDNENQLDPNEPVVDANGNVRPEIARAMTQNSTKQLQELVKALKKLCPPGQEC